MRIITFVVLFDLALAPPATAQDPGPQGFAAGTGVFLNPTALLAGSGGGFDDLFVPIGFGNSTIPARFGARGRIEPEIGWTKTSRSVG